MHRKHLAIFAVLAAMIGVLLVPTAGQAAGAPALAWTPTTSTGTYDFGTVDVSSDPVKTFTLTNSGGSATSALKINLTGTGLSEFSILTNTCSGTSLGPKKHCAVTVEYTQGSYGQSDAATLTAISRKPAATASIELKGATGSPNITISPGTLTGSLYDYDYGDITAPSTQTFTVTNTGAATSPVFHLDCAATHTATCPADSSLSIANDTCTTALAPNGACTFELSIGVTPPPAEGCLTPILGLVGVEDATGNNWAVLVATATWLTC